MNDAGRNAKDGANTGRAGGAITENEGWLEPFRVFFDRSFDRSFATAIELSDSDESNAARLCVKAYSRAYGRWAVLGRVGDPDAFIARSLQRRAPRRAAGPLLLEHGVGYKPWTYVSAIEAGTARRRLSGLAGGAAATACAVALVLGVPGSSQPVDDVSIIGETNQPVRSPASKPELPAAGLPNAAETPANEDPVPESPATDATWNGFTLNLEDLPKSPAEVEGLLTTTRVVP